MINASYSANRLSHDEREVLHVSMEGLKVTTPDHLVRIYPVKGDSARWILFQPTKLRQRLNLSGTDYVLSVSLSVSHIDDLLHKPTGR